MMLTGKKMIGNKTHGKRTKGFTLIETLLVIALMATVASVAILSYRQKGQNTEIDKNAIEMQNVLQAAMAYNVDTAGKWPDAYWVDKTADCYQQLASGVFIDNYLPNSTNENNYGTYFCWQGEGKNGKSDPDANRFSVIMKAPGTGKTATQNAKRIAANMPNAITTSDLTSSTAVACSDSSTDCFVKASIPRPGSTSNIQGKVQFKGAGYCVPPGVDGSTGTTMGVGNATKCVSNSALNYSISFQCPVHTIGKVIAAPNFMHHVEPKKGKDSLAFYNIETGSSYKCITDKATGLINCDVDMTAEFWTGRSAASVATGSQYAGHIGLTYTAVCVPGSVTTNAKLKNLF